MEERTRYFWGMKPISFQMFSGLTPFLRKYKTAATSILYGDENCSGFIMAQTNPQHVWQFSEPNAGYG